MLRKVVDMANSIDDMLALASLLEERRNSDEANQ